MLAMAVTFYDEDGKQHTGELVNAATIIHRGERSIEVQIDRPWTDEITVFTVSSAGEWQTHAVLTGNVRHIVPMELS